MSGYPDHVDSPGQLARIKREPELEESRPAPPTHFTMDPPLQRAAAWPYYERNLSQELDQLLAESRSLISPSSSAAIQHTPLPSQHYTAPVSGQGQTTATAGAAYNAPPGDLVETDNGAARKSDDASQGPGTKREGPSPAPDVPNHGKSDRDLPEEGEVVQSGRLSPPYGEVEHAMGGGDAAHHSGSGPVDTEQDPELAKEVGKALMELNNGAQNKFYRRALDIYKEVKTGDWYGTVYIGPNSRKLKRPVKSVAEAKIRLVDVGLQLLRSLPKANLDMLNHFPQPPDFPPPGFERPPGTTFSRGPKGPAVPNNPPQPSQQPATSTAVQTIRAGSAIRAANDNFVGLLGEWANLNPQYQRPQFETRVVAGVAKATVHLHLSRFKTHFSSLSRLAETEDDADPGNAGRLATQIAKQKAAEQAIRWLVSQRYITKIDSDGHIRRSTKRPGPDSLPEPPAKHAKGANTTPLSMAHPAAKPHSSSLVLRNNDPIPRSGTAGGQSAFSPPSGPSGRLMITNTAGGETARSPPLNAPTGPSKGSGSNTPNDPSRSSRAQSVGAGKGYAQACEVLADALKLGPVVFYWMPVDPMRAPDTAFNCSAHLKGHTENGTLGGAVAELRNLRVSTGEAEAKEAIAKELYEWLSAKREQKRLELQEQMRELGDASLI